MSSSPNPLRLTVIDYEAIPGVTPEQEELAKRRIAEQAQDVDDARLLLDIVFGKLHCRKRRRGEFASRVYQHPMPTGPAGKEYRARVRAWGLGQGFEVTTGGTPEGWLLNAYVQATGDVWQAPAKKGS